MSYNKIHEHVHNTTHWFIFIFINNLIFLSIQRVCKCISLKLILLVWVRPFIGGAHTKRIRATNPNVSHFYWLHNTFECSFGLNYIFNRKVFQWLFSTSSVERRLVTNNLDRFLEISDHNWAYMHFKCIGSFFFSFLLKHIFSAHAYRCNRGMRF